MGLFFTRRPKKKEVKRITMCCQCTNWNVPPHKRHKITEGLCLNQFGYPLTEWDHCCNKGTSLVIQKKKSRFSKLKEKWEDLKISIALWLIK